MRMQIRLKKTIALLLTITMIVTSVIMLQQSTAYAQTKEVTAYVTISDRGNIAHSEGRFMVNVPVKVASKTGAATIDQIMKAFHKSYKPDGYAFDGYVKKLWGVETGNTLFFINNLSCTSGADSEMVKSGDYLTASVNSDDQYYSDYYTYFNKRKMTGVSGGEITLTLKGYLGMTQNAKAEVIKNVEAGLITKDGFKSIEGALTDENGNVILKMDPTQFEVGKTYYITAQGTVPTTVTDWSSPGQPQIDVDALIIAPVCKVIIESKIAAGVKATKITSAKATASKGKITLTWNKEKGYKVDGYEVFKSKKKTSGYGTTPYYKTIKTTYKNTKELKKGTRYYYKVRGCRTVDKVKVYTQWSAVTSAIAK